MVQQLMIALNKQKMLNEYFKEWTFKPKISKKSQEIRKKNLSMMKINNTLNAFDLNKQGTEHMSINIQSSSNGINVLSSPVASPQVIHEENKLVKSIIFSNYL